MKKLHLLCNAHLDPVWLWSRNEGIAEAISTFRTAADFCERYDGFVFNHNEALLYEWVETYEPPLFERIQRLVAQKKWVIMGGWYLQPDCVMTSGESLLSQIELGRTYFLEKFGVTPTTAINFDPFGHSRGLAQILAKTGFDSYLFMRPQAFAGDFWWEGFDGSRVLAHGIYGGYGTLKGKALNKIQTQLAEARPDNDLCLWGVGDHGGGPSRIDLKSIHAFMKECDVPLIHSTAEAYFAEVDRTALPVVRESLVPSMVGCYTSMVRIKQANRRLENKLAVAEKALCGAMMNTAVRFDTSELVKAKKALAFCQFHDILPGSAIRAVEEDSLRTLGYGEEIADRLCAQAFFALCNGQKPAVEGEIPVMVFNPHPYAVEGDFEVEFTLPNQNWNDGEHTVVQVYDADGVPLPTQNEKPSCTFNLDWVLHVSFHGVLAPASVTRFDCRLTVTRGDQAITQTADDVTVTTERMTVTVSRKTGLIERCEIDGRPVCTGGVIEVCRDNEDPWGMSAPADSFCDRKGVFSLMSDGDANALTGYPEETVPAVRVVEDGAVRTKVQASFAYGRSAAVVEYTLPKRGAYVDVDILLYSNEPDVMLKYRLDAAFSGTPIGETAFGYQELSDNEREEVFHKWCGLRGDQRLYVLNRGTYGGSFTDNTIRLSLLRTPIYAAHPIYDDKTLPYRQIAPHDRWTDHIDMGERRFSFRITADEPIRQAQVFNEQPLALSFFPSGDGKAPACFATVDAPSVVLSSIKKTDNGYRLTLHNAGDTVCDATVSLPPLGWQSSLHFGAQELKFVDVSI